MSETDLKQRIAAEVRDELAAIEQALEANLVPHVGLTREIAGHLLFAGGKRLRPLLMVICGRLCGSPEGCDADIATVFEYIHAATLLHDDVIDGGLLRRGRPAAHRVWDPAAVVLTGDFLMARSLSIAARTGRARVLEVVAEVAEEMAQGEILQLQRKGKLDLTRDEYLRIIRCKTAVLFEGACRVSALMADARPEAEQALGAYGRHLGLAFQMADDLLDYTEDSAALGKIPGADLREGKLTLPVIHALTRASAEDRRTMTDLLEQRNFSAENFALLVALLENHDGIAHTRRQAATEVAGAKAALGFFPDSRLRGLLADIADYVLMRKS